VAFTRVNGRMTDSVPAMHAMHVFGATMSAVAKTKGGWRRSNPRSDPHKLSSRILEFARPLFAALAPEPTAEQARRILGMAIPIWNAQILEQRGAKAELIEDLRQRVKEGETTELAFLVAQLFQRKGELFPDDVRLVGKHDVRENKDGSWELFVTPGK
jgi:hypothetical protein